MQAVPKTPRTPAEHGCSMDGIRPRSGVDDSGIGQTFFPPDLSEGVEASTPAPQTSIGEHQKTTNGYSDTSKSARSWKSFVLFWIVMVCATFLYNKFESVKQYYKTAVYELLELFGSSGWIYSALVVVFLVFLFVKLHWINHCDAEPKLVLSPVPHSRHLSSKKTNHDCQKAKVIVKEDTGLPTKREFPCRRTFSGQESDSWHDFRLYFQNISQLNHWSSDHASMALLCCLRSQEEAYAYGLSTFDQADMDLLLTKLEERFGSFNMKDSFIAEAKLRHEGRDESYRGFGQAIEDLLHKVYPETSDMVREHTSSKFLDNYHDPSVFRLAVQSTNPTSEQETVTSRMQEEGDGTDESNRDREDSDGYREVAICDEDITIDDGEVVKVGEDAMEITDGDGEVTEAGEDAATKYDGDGDTKVSKISEDVKQDRDGDTDVSDVGEDVEQDTDDDTGVSEVGKAMAQDFDGDGDEVEVSEELAQEIDGDAGVVEVCEGVAQDSYEDGEVREVIKDKAQYINSEGEKAENGDGATEIESYGNGEVVRLARTQRKLVVTVTEKWRWFAKTRRKFIVTLTENWQWLSRTRSKMNVTVTEMCKRLT